MGNYNLQTLTVREVNDYPDKPQATVACTCIDVTYVNDVADGDLGKLIESLLKKHRCHTYYIKENKTITCWGASGATQEIILYIMSGMACSVTSSIVNSLIKWARSKKSGEVAIGFVEPEWASQRAGNLLRSEFKIDDTLELVSIIDGHDNYEIKHKCNDCFFMTSIDKNGIVIHAKKCQ